MHIKIGEVVSIRGRVRIRSFSADTLEIEVETGDIIKAPRFISALGQFLPGYNWAQTPSESSIPNDFYLTGKYILNNELKQSRQLTSEELDSALSDFIGQDLPGAVFYGKVVDIFAVYTVKGWEKIESDIGFFNDTKDATHDSYAREVFCIIQDLGSYVEYPLSFLLLTHL